MKGSKKNKRSSGGFTETLRILASTKPIGKKEERALAREGVSVGLSGLTTNNDALFYKHHGKKTYYGLLIPLVEKEKAESLLKKGFAFGIITKKQLDLLYKQGVTHFK